MLLNGSQILAEVLVEQGVDTLFGYPGGSILNICDALYDYRDKIKQIVTAHEQGASHAADGYARATGKTGVVLATSGPGATNLVTGIATAYMDSVPMVAITGNVGTSLIGRDSFQEVYIAGITMPITKHNFVVRKVEDLAETLRSAFRIAASGRKGPVLVDIPKDVTANKCEFTPKEPVDTSYETVLDEEKLKEAARLINEAKRPVIYFGGGVGSSHACVPLRELMQKCEIPATHTLMAAGIVSCDHPLSLGLLGMHGNVTSNRAVHNADLVLAVGTRFSDRVALNPDAFAKNAAIIQIDIDPSEINKNVLVDLSLVGDVRTVLEALLPMLNEAKHPEWQSQLEEWKKLNYVPADDASVLKPHQVMEVISKNAGEDAIYVTDVGQHQLWAAQYTRLLKSRSFLTSGGLGTMGFGYGAALGAKTAFPNRPVIHITGDGSFHMNMNEACTAVNYNIPVITVIMNNSVLGMVRQWQTVFYNRRYSGSEPERVTDYVKVAEGFGLKGFRCTNLSEFEEAMAKAMKMNCPVWIDCVIDREEKVLPMIPAGGTIANMILE